MNKVTMEEAILLIFYEIGYYEKDNTRPLRDIPYGQFGKDPKYPIEVLIRKACSLAKKDEEGLSPKSLHDMVGAYMLRMGWTPGEEYNEKTKTLPVLERWSELEDSWRNLFVLILVIADLVDKKLIIFAD